MKKSEEKEGNHLIENEQSNKTDEIIAFACDDVPFFRGRDDDMGLLDFALAQLHVAGQLHHFQAQEAQRPGELCDDLLGQRLHWGNVYNLHRY